uniref:Uncharacterized protein n=1 Tax=Hanusia phi TaxID=3032 RepID=A0A7S0DXG3_9CRYP
MPVRSGSPPFVACSMDDSVTRRINALHPSISALQRALTSLPNASVAVSDHIAIARPTPIRPGLGESGNTGFESFKRKPQPSDRDDMAEQSPGTKYLKVEPMNCSAPLGQHQAIFNFKDQTSSQPKREMQDANPEPAPCGNPIDQTSMNQTKRNRRTKKEVELARMQELKVKLSKFSLEEIANLSPAVKCLQQDLFQILQTLDPNKGEVAMYEARAQVLFTLQKFETQQSLPGSSDLTKHIELGNVPNQLGS